jgi:hypothetical protein
MGNEVYLTKEESEILKDCLLDYVVYILQRKGDRDDWGFFPAALDALLQNFTAARAGEP